MLLQKCEEDCIIAALDILSKGRIRNFILQTNGSQVIKNG